MVLHTVSAITASGTGGGTADTCASTGFSPSGDNEVQVRGGNLPKWVGIDSASWDLVQIGATSAKDWIQVYLNTDTQAQYWLSHYRKHTMGAAAKFGNMIDPGILWFPSAVELPQDADWTVKTAQTTASKNAAVFLYLSYGAPIKSRGGRIISRKVVFTSDDGAGPTSWTAGPNITDLDPRLTYRVAGIQGLNVEDNDHIGFRVTSASNNTYAGALSPSWTATTFHLDTQITWFDYDSILVSGVESVIVESLSVAAQKPTCAVFFEEYGTSGQFQTAANTQRAMTPTSGASLGGVARTGGFGGLFGIGR